MSDKNALTTMDFSGPTKKTSLEQFKPTNRFLQRIELCGANGYVKRGQIPPGHIGIHNGKEVIDLGKNADLLFLGLRAKCLDLNGDKPLAVFDESNPEYLRIYWEVYSQAKYLDAGGELNELGLPATEGIKLSVIKGNNNTMTGFLQGPDFLVYERSTKAFYELFCQNASHKRESGAMSDFLPIGLEEAEETGVDPQGPIPCNYSGDFKEGGDFEYWVPVITKSSAPFDDLPPQAVFNAQRKSFMDADIEGGDEEADDGSQAR